MGTTVYESREIASPSDGRRPFPTAPDHMETRLTMSFTQLDSVSVFQVSARDNDWGTNALISYSLKEKNQYFAIDNSTGIIKTRSQLQRSGKPLRLTVLARDNGKPPLFSQVTVSLTVLSVGNDPPKFTQSVYVKHIRENQRIASHIITVKATSSRPGKISYIIEDGNLPSTNNPRLFDVGLRSGRVWTRGILDYETTPNFTLKIRASVGYPKLISFATLKIFLEDVNDSPPDFIFREYKSQVSLKIDYISSS